MVRFGRIEIDEIGKFELVEKVRNRLNEVACLEIDYKKLPPPKIFREHLLTLREEFSANQVFLSEKDAVIAGVLFNINMSRPRRAVVEIANGCNLKCDFCWTHSPLLEIKPPSNWLKETLDIDLIYSYLDYLDTFGTVRLVEFCAVGDPLYHPGFWYILEYAKSKKFKIRISTNATLLTPEKWDKYCSDQIDELYMNISAGNRDIYSDIHNVNPRVFDQLMSNLKYLNHYRSINKKKLKMRWINIITVKNLSNIPEIIDRGIEFGANSFDFRNVWIHKNFQKNLVVSKKDITENYDIIAQAEKKLIISGIENNFNKFIDSFLQGESK